MGNTNLIHEGDLPRTASVIWGDECWWDDADTMPPLDKAQQDLEGHKAFLQIGLANKIKPGI